MGITRVDCHFFRGEQVPLEQSSYVAVNPHRRPGSVVMAGAGAVRNSIGSHVASKLALQHFAESVLQDIEATSSEPGSGSSPALQLIEGAFKAANHSVYQFGHKLAAGGRLAASLIGVVIEEGVIAAGRVGAGNAYLCRDLEVFPFFESLMATQESEEQGSSGRSESSEASDTSSIDGFVGTQSLVSVELASVELRPRDVVFLTAQELDTFGERELYGIMEDFGFVTGDDVTPRARSAFGCEQVVQALYQNPEQIPFAMVAVVGPEAVYLSPVRSVQKSSEVVSSGALTVERVTQESSMEISAPLVISEAHHARSDQMPSKARSGGY